LFDARRDEAMRVAIWSFSVQNVKVFFAIKRLQELPFDAKNVGVKALDLINNF
jgi:hypothetical protein